MTGVVVRGRGKHEERREESTAAPGGGLVVADNEGGLQLHLAMKCLKIISIEV